MQAVEHHHPPIPVRRPAGLADKLTSLIIAVAMRDRDVAVEAREALLHHDGLGIFRLELRRSACLAVDLVQAYAAAPPETRHWFLVALTQIEAVLEHYLVRQSQLDNARGVA